MVYPSHLVSDKYNRPGHPPIYTHRDVEEPLKSLDVDG